MRTSPFRRPTFARISPDVREHARARSRPVPTPYLSASLTAVLKAKGSGGANYV